MIRFHGITIDRERRIIGHRGRQTYFGKIGFKIVCILLLDSPRNAKEMINIIWRDNPEGGPDDAQKCLDYHFHLIKEKLQVLEINILSRNYWNKRRWAEPAPPAEIMEET
jgi:hypothetical protein